MNKNISPVYDALVAEVSQSQGQFTDVEFDSAVWEVDVLLEVVTQVSSQKQVHHHKHVLLILEGIPAGEGQRDAKRFGNETIRDLGRCIQER